MSRSVSIFYRHSPTGPDVDVPVEMSRDILGGQRSNLKFWGLPRLRELGITRLAELGVTDPVMFYGGDDLAVFRRELRILGDNLARIDFHLETRAMWLSNLIYCYHMLAATAPPDSIPIFIIG